MSIILYVPTWMSTMARLIYVFMFLDSALNDAESDGWKSGAISLIVIIVLILATVAAIVGFIGKTSFYNYDPSGKSKY